MSDQAHLSTFKASSAWIDGEYRYRLDRWWGDGPRLGWIMLNPSTADGVHDDPTIRRCIGFAKRCGYDGIVVVNLFARRCTRPEHLADPGDPVGPHNNEAILNMGYYCPVVVAAWGAHPVARGHVLSVASTMEAARRTLHCLGVTQGGAPRHPLYVRADAELVPWQTTPAS